MKLRIKDNSLRVRLDRRDIAQLLEVGRIENHLAFGPTTGERLDYVVDLTPDLTSGPSAGYRSGRIRVSIGAVAARLWADGDKVGFEPPSAISHGEVRLLVEKDFACLDRPADAAEDDAWAFPNPAADRPAK